MIVFRLFRKLDKFAFHLAAVLIATLGLTYMYSKVEGYIDPVMEPLKIYNIRRGPSEFDVTFDGQAVKLRGDCEWIESRWYIGERWERSQRTQWDFTDRPQIREGGLLVWEDQIAAMTPQELVQNSHADTIHSCPWRLWPVVTPFYDSDDDLELPELGPPVVSPLEQQIQSLRKELEQLK